jgi:cytochrome c oxidase subunit 2
VPVGRPVRLLMTSRDVIHSFYVPAFRVKRDVLPGRYSELWFQAVAPGRYELLCAEYCGTGHSYMRGEIVALAPEAFDRWMADQTRGREAVADVSQTALGVERGSPGNLQRTGERVAAERGCLKCHSLDGTAHIGPTWRGLYGRTEPLVGGTSVVVDEPYMTESMMEPTAKVVMGFQPVMPSYQGRLSPPEVAAILEFIKSLRDPQLEARPSQGPVYGPN